MSTGFTYSPIHLTSRAVDSDDHDGQGSYALRKGVTTLYDPDDSGTNGPLHLRFPDASPNDNDWVQIKNIAYNSAYRDTPIYIEPTGNVGEEVEMPAHDTDVMTSNSFPLVDRHGGIRWCFVTDIGWVIDFSHLLREQRQVTGSAIFYDDFVRSTDTTCTSTGIDVNEDFEPPVWRKVFGATCTVEYCKFNLTNNTIYQVVYSELAPRIIAEVGVETTNVAPRLIFNGENDDGQLSLSDYDFLQLTPHATAGQAELAIYRRNAGAETKQDSVTGFTFTATDTATIEVEYANGKATARVYDSNLVLLGEVKEVALSLRGDKIAIAHDHLGGDGDESYWSTYALYRIQHESARFTTLLDTTTDYYAAHNEIVLADTDTAGGECTVKLSSSLPDGSIVTVKKTAADLENVNIDPEGTRTIESPHFGIAESSTVIATPRMSATWIATPTKWELIGAAHDGYREYFYLASAHTITSAGSVVPIAIDTALTPSPASGETNMFSVSGGVLTALVDLVVEIEITMRIGLDADSGESLQISVAQQTTGSDVRASDVGCGTYGRGQKFYESRSVKARVTLDATETYQLFAKEEYAGGTSTGTIEELELVVRPLT